MKLKEALPIYRGYRQQLVEQTRTLVKQRDTAKSKFEATGDAKWSEQAATLQLSVEASSKEFDKNQEILDSLMVQWANAANAETAKALADPETGMAAELSKIMKTVARMCAGDKVPASDEKKVMEYDSDLYGKAKQAQMAMAQIKKKRKEYEESLWDDEDEGQKYDPEGVADETEAQGDLSYEPDLSIGGEGTD